MFYEIWGNDPTSEVCTGYFDPAGNVYEVCVFTRATYDYGWGEISSTDIVFDASGAQLTTTTGANFSTSRCTTDTSGPTPVTACAPAGPVTFDLDWTSGFAGIVCTTYAVPPVPTSCEPAVPAVPSPILSSQSTLGLTQYNIGTFRFENLVLVKATSAYAYGTALGRRLDFAPGRLGVTKGNTVDRPPTATGGGPPSFLRNFATYCQSQVPTPGDIMRAMSTPAIDIASLDAAARLRLIEELWESLRGNPDSVPMTDAQRNELDRRLDVIDRGDDAGIPWDEVLNRIRKPMR